jgi:ketosteroid isomerase-like protein
MPQIPKLTLLLLCLLPVLAVAQAQPSSEVAKKPSSEVAKILALEKRWTDAYKYRDISILSSLLAEDFVITVEDGSTYGKSGYITHSADPSVHVEIAEQAAVKVRIHGNTAIVTGGYHEKGSSKGKPYEYRDRFTDVLMKVNSNWQVIASHYSVPRSD